MTDFIKMNASPETSSLIEAEALAWIAQLNGDDVTEKDLAAFREWVNRSPLHQKEIRELSQLWGELNWLTTMDEPIRQADSLSKQLRKRQAMKQWKRKVFSPGFVGALAAITVIAFPIAIAFNQNAATYEAAVNVPLVFKTVKGERQTHMLEDGSVITLNTDSHIEVDFTKGQRDVRLLKGEALFSVAHDERRPFLVFADDGIVRAVGTQFSVHLKQGLIEVLVSEGSVELSTLKPTKPITTERQASEDVTKVASLGFIKAGHAAQMKDSTASIANVSEARIDAELSWREGRLEFTGEGLEEALAEYTRYTDLKIVITDPTLKDIRLGGSFPTGEMDRFFDALTEQFDIKVERVDEANVFLSKAG